MIIRAEGLILEFIGHLLASFLIGKAVPYAIARINYEPVILRPLNNLDVGFSGDSLISGIRLRFILVLEVSEGSGERKISIDSVFTDEMSGGIDPLFLFGVARLVVVAQLDNDVVFLAENGAAVARVSTNDL